MLNLFYYIMLNFQVYNSVFPLSKVSQTANTNSTIVVYSTVQCA